MMGRALATARAGGEVGRPGPSDPTGRLVLPCSGICDGFEILGVRCFAQGGDGGCESRRIHPAIAETDFLEACHLESLMAFDGTHELGGFEQRFMDARIEPGVAAAKQFDVEVAAFEVGAVDLL